MKKLASIPLAYVGRRVVSYYVSKGMFLYAFANRHDLEDARGLELIRHIKKETEMLLADQEAFLIYTTVKKVSKIEGELAEVGVYKGGSAKLMREASEKPLHLFDTFEGLPELCEKDNPKQFQKGNYPASLESVQRYLSGYAGVHYYKGVFPSTAEPVKDKRFSFVHFDVDIYESTLQCLEFFYPRMSTGGIMISHDYPKSDGVRKAFDEFFKTKPEVILQPYATGQALVVKVV